MAKAASQETLKTRLMHALPFLHSFEHVCTKVGQASACNSKRTVIVYSTLCQWTSVLGPQFFGGQLTIHGKLAY